MSSYLFAWLLFLGLALGGMANLMLLNLTGGRWGALVRPAFLAATRLVPLAALLAIPVLVAMRSLFPIADSGWFSPGLFLFRSIAYLVISAFEPRPVLLTMRDRYVLMVFTLRSIISDI